MATTAARAPFRWRQTTAVQRRTLLAAGLGWMLDAFDVMLYSIVLATLVREFGLTKASAGLLNSLTLIASAIGSFVFGLLADRYGRRRMLSASILTYSAFTFACGFSTSVSTLACCRFLLGLGMGGEWNTGATLVAETWPGEWRGRALGIVQSSWAVGYALAVVISQLLLGRFGWRSVFFAGALPALVVAWIQKSVPEPEVWRRQRNSPPSPLEWRKSRRSLLTLLAMNTGGMFAWWGLFAWIPAYLALPATSGGRGLGKPGFTGFLLVLNLVGMLPGYLSFGVFADRFGRKPVLIFYLVMAALFVPVFAAARTPIALLVSATVAAFFGTGFFTGSGLIGSELFPTAIRATALGISYNAARGLSALAPLVIGSIGEKHGLPWGFAACGIAFAWSACWAIALPETKGAGMVE